MWTKRIKVQRISGPQRRKKEDQLVLDSEYDLQCNSLQATFNAVPGLTKEMIVGFLFHKEKINSYNDIKTIEAEENKFIVELNELRAESPTPQSKWALNAKFLFSKMYDFQDKAILFRDCAISHSSALGKENEIICFAEDIERMQAVYKTIGTCLIENYDLSETIFLCSSKLDKALIRTLHRLGIGVYVTRVGATGTAYDYAQEHQLTLIGFCRAQKCNLYCGELYT